MGNIEVRSEEDIPMTLTPCPYGPMTRTSGRASSTVAEKKYDNEDKRLIDPVSPEISFPCPSNRGDDARTNHNGQRNILQPQENENIPKGPKMEWVERQNAGNDNLQHYPYPPTREDNNVGTTHSGRIMSFQNQTSPSAAEFQENMISGGLLTENGGLLTEDIVRQEHVVDDENNKEKMLLTSGRQISVSTSQRSLIKRSSNKKWPQPQNEHQKGGSESDIFSTRSVGSESGVTRQKVEKSSVVSSESSIKITTTSEKIDTNDTPFKGRDGMQKSVSFPYDYQSTGGTGSFMTSDSCGTGYFSVTGSNNSINSGFGPFTYCQLPSEINGIFDPLEDSLPDEYQGSEIKKSSPSVFSDRSLIECGPSYRKSSSETYTHEVDNVDVPLCQISERKETSNVPNCKFSEIAHQSVISDGLHKNSGPFHPNISDDQSSVDGNCWSIPSGKSSAPEDQCSRQCNSDHNVNFERHSASNASKVVDGNCCNSKRNSHETGLENVAPLHYQSIPTEEVDGKSHSKKTFFGLSTEEHRKIFTSQLKAQSDIYKHDTGQFNMDCMMPDSLLSGKDERRTIVGSIPRVKDKECEDPVMALSKKILPSKSSKGSPTTRQNITVQNDDNVHVSTDQAVGGVGVTNLPSCTHSQMPMKQIDDKGPEEEQVGGSNRRKLAEDNFLSVFDNGPGGKRYYAAYLCVSKDDLSSFGLSFHKKLEDWGFKIFLSERDLVLKGIEFENMSRVVEERCNGKIIVVLSKNYSNSEECLFLTHFARTLDPDARKRNIIPVTIDRQSDTTIPNVLKGLSIIRYNHDSKFGWLKNKLIDAIAA